MASNIDIIKKLTLEFSFNQNQTDLLLALCQKDCTAQELLKLTSVSNGRIYRLLQELESTGLVEKIPGKSAKYSLKNLGDKINSFLNHSFQSFTTKQKTLLESLSHLDSGPHLSLLSGTKEDFDNEIIRFLDTASWVQILHKHVSLPWFLYLHDETTFFEVRQHIKNSRPIGSSALRHHLLLKRQAYLRTYQNKPVVHLMLRQSALDLFAAFPKLATQLPANLKKYPNVQIFALDKLHNPFSTYLSDKAALQVMFFPSKKDRLLQLQGTEIIETYQDYLNKYLEDALPLIQLLAPAK